MPVGHRNQPDLPRSVNALNASIRSPGSRGACASRPGVEQRTWSASTATIEPRGRKRDAGRRTATATGRAARRSSVASVPRAFASIWRSHGMPRRARLAERRRPRSRRALGAIDRDRDRAADGIVVALEALRRRIAQPDRFGAPQEARSCRASTSANRQPPGRRNSAASAPSTSLVSVPARNTRLGSW